MEALNALRLADEVKTFPTIEMPKPILKEKSKVQVQYAFLIELVVNRCVDFFRG